MVSNSKDTGACPRRQGVNLIYSNPVESLFPEVRYLDPPGKTKRLLRGCSHKESPLS
jgi:hypothetical protein